MKHYILIVLFSFFTITNCSISNDNSEPQLIRVLWNLENVTGGISGIDDNFSPNIVVWEFNELNFTLTVNNTNSNSTLEDGLDSGTYSYNILSGTSSKTYLVIDSNEIGSITVNGNEMVINQNENSSGAGADGYIYTFKKTILVEN